MVRAKEKRYQGTKWVFRQVVKEAGYPLVDYISESTGLSKTRTRDALNKGACRLKRPGRTGKTVRRATRVLHKGEIVEFHFDESILRIDPPMAECISDRKRYSVWFKPAGLMSQGTPFGDHCTITRQAELHFHPRREVFCVHRLDREAQGIILLAHDKQAAAELSKRFRKKQVVKKYIAEVKGKPDADSGWKTITIPLDGKEAVTEYRCTDYNQDLDTAVVEIRLITGRRHQIRRHFERIGHPVMGDPVYGRANKNTDGLKLTAVYLELSCPFEKKRIGFSLDDRTRKPLSECNRSLPP